MMVIYFLLQFIIISEMKRMQNELIEEQDQHLDEIN